jgi:hypothetical protein
MSARRNYRYLPPERENADDALTVAEVRRRVGCTLDTLAKIIEAGALAEPTELPSGQLGWEGSAAEAARKWAESIVRAGRPVR